MQKVSHSGDDSRFISWVQLGLIFGSSDTVKLIKRIYNIYSLAEFPRRTLGCTLTPPLTLFPRRLTLGCTFTPPLTPFPPANNESSEVCGIIKPSQRVKLNRSQAVNVHKLLTIRYLLPANSHYTVGVFN